jgi:hypothetical protein
MRALLGTILIALLFFPFLACGDKTETPETNPTGPDIKQRLMPIAMAPASADFGWTVDRIDGTSYPNKEYFATLWITDGGEHEFETAGILYDYMGNCPYGCPEGYNIAEMTLCTVSQDTAYFEVIFEHDGYFSPCLSWYAHFDEPDGQQLGYWHGSCYNKNTGYVEDPEVCDPPSGGKNPPPWEE